MILGYSDLKIKTSESDILTISNINDHDFKYSDEDIEHKNKITGSRIFGAKGDHLIFSCNVNICKESAPGSVLDDIWPYYKGNVYLAPFGDLFIKDENGDEVLFFFKKCFSFYYDVPSYPDKLLLEFHSLEWIDIQQSSLVVLLDDLDKYILDDLDNKIG